MKKKTDYFNIILDIIIILVAILVIYWGLQLIFGGSPGLSEFNFGLIVVIGGLLFKIYREVGEIKVGMRYSFSKIKDDMSLIKKKLKIE